MDHMILHPNTNISLYRVARGFGKFSAICCRSATATKGFFWHAHSTLTAQIHSKFGLRRRASDGLERIYRTMMRVGDEPGTWRDGVEGRQPAARLQLVSALVLGCLALTGLFPPQARAESRGLVGIRSAALQASTLTIAKAVSLENGTDRAQLSFDLSQPVAAT